MVVSWQWGGFIVSRSRPICRYGFGDEPIFALSRFRQPCLGTHKKGVTPICKTASRSGSDHAKAVSWIPQLVVTRAEVTVEHGQFLVILGRFDFLGSHGVEYSQFWVHLETLLSYKSSFWKKKYTNLIDVWLFLSWNVNNATKWSSECGCTSYMFHHLGSSEMYHWRTTKIKINNEMVA